MKTRVLLLLTILSLLGLPAVFSQTVTWQMHHGQGMGIYEPPEGSPSVREILTELYGPNSPQHGDSGGYRYAEIPTANDGGWEEAPVDPEDGQLCFRLDRSQLTGFMTALDFTYFQTFITISDPSKPFIIRYDEVDDGVRAYVFNAAHPEGAFLPDGPDDDPMPDGDARLYKTPATADISSLLVRGKNRIVLVQFDNASTENYLKVVVEQDEACEDDTEAPQIFNELADGNLIPMAEYLQGSTAECGEEPVINPVIIDNCDLNPVLDTTRTELPGGNGNTLVLLNFVATDKSGNSRPESYSFSVGQDREAPQVFAQVDSTSLAPIDDFLGQSFNCAEQPDLGLLVAVDDCDPAPELRTFLVSEINPIDSSETFRLLVEAEDNSGKLYQDTFFYTVFRDTAGPEINVQLPDGRVVLFSEHIQESYECGELPSQNWRLIDNCDPNPSIRVQGSAIPIGNGSFRRPISITATDASGNVTFEEYEYITVADTLPPVLEGCVDRLTVTLDLCGQFELTPENLGITARDNCTDSVAIDFNELMLEGEGMTTLKVRATDEAENEASCEILITAVENPDIITVNAENDLDFSMDMDESIVFQPADLLANDSASNGAALEIQDLFVVNLDQGRVINNGDGSFTFVPTPGFAGFVQLRYVAAVAGLLPDPNSPNCVPDFTDEAIIRLRVKSPRVCNLGIEGIGLMCPDDITGTIVLTAFDSDVPVEYSIDGFIWKDSNIFEGKELGTYRVFVREKDFTFCEATGFVTLTPVDSLAPEIIGCPADTVSVELNANGEFIPGLDFLGIEVSDNCTSTDDLTISFSPSIITAETESVDLIAEDLNGNTDTCSFLVDPVFIETAPFVTTWETTALSPEVIIYTNPSYSYNYSIDWGDGTVEENVTGQASHTYTDHSAPQVVSIRGAFPHFMAGDIDRSRGPFVLDPLIDDENANKLLTVEQWGDMAWRDMSYSFARAKLINFNAEDTPDLSSVSSFRATFLGAISFNSDIGDWDVSNVTGMTSMFHRASEFNQDISGWDVSNVTSFAYMFNNADNFNQDISGWEVSSLRVTYLMFFYADNFNQDIGGWDMSNVIEAYSMLAGAGSFDHNLGQWDLSSLSTEFVDDPASNMLSDCGMSIENYDATLNGWAAQADNFPSDLAIGVSGLTYSCDGKQGRDILINSLNWTFDGDALDGDCPAEGIVEDEAAEENNIALHLFPNPATDLLQMELTSERLKRVEVRDRLGRLLWSKSLSGDQASIQLNLDQGQFPIGLYTVSLFSEEGFVVSKRISIID